MSIRQQSSANQQLNRRRCVSGSVRFGLVVFALPVSLLLVGCGVEPEMLARIEQVSLREGQITASFDDSASKSFTPSDASTEFKPAFPEREDPFHVDKVEVAETVQQTESSDIRVVGFAKMGRQQAILKIGDDTKFVQVGDRIGEIVVISISPPRVR
ncbi:unnamed protein product, partial [Hapterophycus canaliculatus]